MSCRALPICLHMGWRAYKTFQPAVSPVARHCYLFGGLYAQVGWSLGPNTYSTILRGLALNHYYTNLKSISLGVPFNKLYKAIYNYFKGPEYKCNILT